MKSKVFVGLVLGLGISLAQACPTLERLREPVRIGPQSTETWYPVAIQTAPGCVRAVSSSVAWLVADFDNASGQVLLKAQATDAQSVRSAEVVVLHGRQRWEFTVQQAPFPPSPLEGSPTNLDSQEKSHASKEDVAFE